MKVLVIGDLHGLNVWEKLVEQDSFDRVIFLGDYVDSFSAIDSDIFTNLQNVIEYKKKNPEKVILLLGNHDIQYIWEGNDCSGKRYSMATGLKTIFEDNLDLFKICYQEGMYLFSHAGFTNQWEKDNIDMIDEFFPDGFHSYEDLNEVFFKTSFRDRFCQCGASRGGFDKFSGPLWADKSDTTKNGISGHIQVVGHTKVPSIQRLPHIIYCDCLEYGNGQPLILEIE